MKYQDPDHIESSENFRMIHKLHYDEILGFVFENIRKKTFSSRFYFAFNILTLILIVYFLIYGLRNNTLTFKEFGLQFFIGMFAGSFLVIPFHEGFHGLAYKLTGAPKIQFGADMKQMIFYVTADRYVLNRKGFYFLAYTPFVMINILAIGLYFFIPAIEIHTLLFFLLFHNAMCIGDLAMVSFYESHPGSELYTFDDVPKRVSYIYERIKDKSD